VARVNTQVRRQCREKLTKSEERENGGGKGKVPHAERDKIEIKDVGVVR
jgi:hypothetical protein